MKLNVRITPDFDPREVVTDLTETPGVSAVRPLYPGEGGRLGRYFTVSVLPSAADDVAGRLRGKHCIEHVEPQPIRRLVKPVAPMAPVAGTRVRRATHRG